MTQKELEIQNFKNRRASLLAASTIKAALLRRGMVVSDEDILQSAKRMFAWLSGGRL